MNAKRIECDAERKTAPTDALGHNGLELTFRIWADNRWYQEDPRPWKLLACFQYLQEALDYIAYCQDRGSDVVFQSPADCQLIKATDRRVKCRPTVA